MANIHTEEEQKIIDAALLENKLKASEQRTADKIRAILDEENCEIIPMQSFDNVEIIAGEIRFKNPAAMVRFQSKERQAI